MSDTLILRSAVPPESLHNAQLGHFADAWLASFSESMLAVRR